VKEAWAHTHDRVIAGAEVAFAAKRARAAQLEREAAAAEEKVREEASLKKAAEEEARKAELERSRRGEVWKSGLHHAAFLERSKRFDETSERGGT